MKKTKVKKQTKKARANAATSLTELAEVHGVTRQAVSKWIADPRWADEGLSTRPPWNPKDIARQKQWREAMLQDVRNKPSGDDGAGDAAAAVGVPSIGRAEKVARIKLLVAREEETRVDIAIKKSEYVLRDEVERNEALKWRVVKETFMQLPLVLRVQLAEASEPSKTQEILEFAFRAIFTSFAQGDV